MKKEKYNIHKDSFLYKKNVEIHGRLWKVYALTLVVSLIFIMVQGVNIG